MPAVTRYQLGASSQTNYTNYRTVSHFNEVVGYNVRPIHARVESKSMRSGGAVRRNDRDQPYKVGAGGTIDLEVPTKGFAFWLPHMLGTCNSSATATNGTTWSATILTTKGNYFSLQENFPFHPADSNQAFSYTGGKVTKWSLENAVGGVLNVQLETDFYDYSTNVSLTSASYATSFNLLTFVGGAVTIGGTSVNILSIKLDYDAGIKPDMETYIRADTRKLEPQQREYVEIGWEISCDWEDLSHFNRFANAVASGLLAQIVATWTGPVPINAGAVYPSLQLTIDEARFDMAHPVDVNGPDPLDQVISGVGLFDGTDTAVKLVYVAEDDGS